MVFSALRLGLPFVPSYLGHVGAVEDMIRGVNYASASAGVIFTSGSELVLLFFNFNLFYPLIKIIEKYPNGTVSNQVDFDFFQQFHVML